MEVNLMMDLYKGGKYAAQAKAKQMLEKALFAIPPEKLDDADAYVLEILSVAENHFYEDYLDEYFIRLLTTAFNKDRKGIIHPSFAHILKSLTRDEINILQQIHGNDFHFIQISDLINHRFSNHRHTKFEFPKESLINPEDFYFHIFNLHDVLHLISWPVYKTEPIVDGGTQTGSAQYSHLIETQLGAKFNACLFD